MSLFMPDMDEGRVTLDIVSWFHLYTLLLEVLGMPRHWYLLQLVRNKTLTLIEREDDTRSWRIFLICLTLYYNVIPFKGLEIHTYRLLASQEYARC
jgi:hypothetical protein